MGRAGGGVAKRVVCDLKGIKVGMMIDRSGVGHETGVRRRECGVI